MASDFPSLGGASTKKKVPTPAANPYAAAQAHAKKLREQGLSSDPFPSLNSKSDFPPPPTSTAGHKKANAVTALAPKKPPPVDNLLQSPPPPKSSAANLKAGMNTVEQLKEQLGSVRYKKLKSLTKSFASGSTRPEQYVEEAAALFDQGLADTFFWSHVPDLIVSCPNTVGVNSALVHLQSLRVANQLQQMEFGGR
jgi:hypothetical protein